MRPRTSPIGTDGAESVINVTGLSEEVAEMTGSAEPFDPGFLTSAINRRIGTDPLIGPGLT